MVKSVKLIMANGEEILFAPEASIPPSRNTDGLLGSLGLDVFAIIYIFMCLLFY